MLDERPDEFDERNLFLQAILGLVAVSGRLDEAIAAVSDEEPVASDDRWLTCVLGMVAVRERVAAALAGAPSTARSFPSISRPAGAMRAPAASASPLTEILR